jgi:hypothetical protein
MDRRKDGWGWGWWVLAVAALASVVFAVRPFVPLHGARPAVQPVVLSRTETLTSPWDLFTIELGGKSAASPEGQPADGPERTFPESWDGQVLNALLELEIPAGKSATIGFAEFAQVEQHADGAWVALRPQRHGERAAQFSVALEPGKQVFRGVFRTSDGGRSAAPPYVIVFHQAEGKRSVRYRVTVKPAD